MNEAVFMGKDLQFWIELKRRFDADAGPDAYRLLNEIIALRAKLSFFESRIAEMAKVMANE